MNISVAFHFLFLFIFSIVLPVSKTWTWTLHRSVKRIFPNQPGRLVTSTSIFTKKEDNNGKRGVNPFDMNDEELGLLKQDMTKDLFEEMAQGQSTVTVTDFVENFQEIIQLGLITESDIQGVFKKNGVIPLTSTEASTKSNQMNYEQFKQCFAEINQICFNGTYDQELEDEDNHTGEGEGGSGGKGFGKKPPSPRNGDPFGDIPDGYTFRP